MPPYTIGQEYAPNGDIFNVYVTRDGKIKRTKIGNVHDSEGAKEWWNSLDLDRKARISMIVDVVMTEWKSLTTAEQGRVSALYDEYVDESLVEQEVEN